jgi:hypothetical protein
MLSSSTLCFLQDGQQAEEEAKMRRLSRCEETHWNNPASFNVKRRLSQ